FYHPAVWWISGQVRIERENCCDDLAIAVCGNPLQYARALTRLEELRAQATPLAVSANGGSLLDRIRRLVSDSSRATGPVRGAAALALLVAMLLAIAAPSFSANAKRGAEAKPAKRSASAEPAKASTGVTKAEVKPDDADAPDTHSLQFVDSADQIPDPYREAMQVSASGRKPLKLTVDDLIALRSQNVTPAMIEDMRTLFPDIEPREMASMAAVGVTPEFVSRMRSAGIDAKSASAASTLAPPGP